MLTRIKIIGSAVAVVCALAIGQSAPPAHATQTGSDTGSARGTAWPRNTAWPWPLIGDVLTAYRNGDDPYAAGQHRGVDIAAPVGTPARAVVAGTVTFSGKLPDDGNVVTVRTDNAEYLVSYLHLSDRAVVRGASVAVGETLGRSGMTGRRSIEAPHLHFSVRVAATRAYVDPMSLLGEPRLAAPTTSDSGPAEVGRPMSDRVAPRPVALAPLEDQARNRASAQRERSERAARGGAPATGTHDGVASTSTAQSQHDSLRAPAPVEIEHDSKAAGETRTDVQNAIGSPKSAPAQSRTAQRIEHDELPLRPILLALSALAFIGLLANRRPRSSADASHPRQPSPSAIDDEAKVVALDVSRPPLSAQARGGTHSSRD